MPLVRKPTSASSEQQVTMAPNSAPWESGTSGKYQYHPGGDKSQVKDAPSALHSVIIPNVNLPKVSPVICVQWKMRILSPDDAIVNVVHRSRTGANTLLS